MTGWDTSAWATALKLAIGPSYSKNSLNQGITTFQLDPEGENQRLVVNLLVLIILAAKSLPDFTCSTFLTMLKAPLQGWTQVNEKKKSIPDLPTGSGAGAK